MTSAQHLVRASRYEARARHKQFRHDAEWMLVLAAVHRVLAEVKESRVKEAA